MTAISSTLLAGALGLFWVGMLGLLWRRSLVGMLIGVLLGWLSVGVAAVAFGLSRPDAEGAVGGAILVLCVAFTCVLQVALGLSIVVVRLARRGSLDVQDAELLEG